MVIYFDAAAAAAYASSGYGVAVKVSMTMDETMTMARIYHRMCLNKTTNKNELRCCEPPTIISLSCVTRLYRAIHPSALTMISKFTHRSIGDAKLHQFTHAHKIRFNRFGCKAYCEAARYTLDIVCE